jgi:ABC-type uncharacterized transport system auxiliary subunit
MGRPSHHLARASVAWLPLVALGCISGPAPSDHFYRLEPGAPAALRAPRLTGTLEVDRLRSDALTNERAMLYRETSESTQVNQYSYHQWVDSPTLLLQTALTTYLRVAGVASRVVTPELRAEPDFRLTGRLLRLERVLRGPGSGVVVEIELALSDALGDRILLLETYREERSAGGGVHEAVVAFNEAVTAIFQRLLAELPTSAAP